jgi:putative transposase
VRRQCELLGLCRSSLYYEPAAETAENLRLMRLIDEEYTAHPFLGSRRLTKWLIEHGEAVNRKRVQRLLRLMGLEAIYPKPKLSAAGQGHRICPYLLRDVRLERPDQVWSTDITYVPLASGFMYLAAVIDWFSRYVIAWRLSNTLDGSFCLEMLDEALSRGRPEVFNTDQGVQFTAQAWTGRLESAGVAVSMDGRGRCLDNVFVERLWRTVKYEDSTCGGMRRCRSCSEGWGGTSPTTTRSARTRPWITEHRRPCISRGEPEGGRRGEGEAFFFAPPSLSPGEGRPVRKRMPWSRAEGQQRRGRAEFSRIVA